MTASTRYRHGLHRPTATIEAMAWEKFARTYAAQVIATLEPHELQAVKNGASEHDFYDANETTVWAFNEVFGRDPLFLGAAGPDTDAAQAELGKINDALDVAFNIIRR